MWNKERNNNLHYVCLHKLSKSMFIALQKTPGATECDLYRTTNQMSQNKAFTLRFIMTRKWQRVSWAQRRFRDYECNLNGDNVIRESYGNAERFE